MRVYTTKQSRFRNGQLREKFSVSKGCKHGAARTWHRNGVLATEQFFKDGLLHGCCRQWAESGRLLGRFTMDRGTGVLREWHENGYLKIEVSTVAGKFSGRNRLWLRDGTLISESFYFNNRQVTSSQYAKAAVKDESLPRYTDLRTRLPRRSNSFERHILENFLTGLLEKSDRNEARLWFDGGKERGRLLGRFRSQRTALAFIESLYAAGASEVIVPGIYRDKQGNEYADMLLVRLPRAKTDRARIRKACASLGRRLLGALEPNRDIGESHLFLLLK